MPMHAFKFPRIGRFTAALSLAILLFVLTAVTAFANIALALLPANGLLIAILFLFSRDYGRIVVILLFAVIFASIAIGSKLPHVGALAFAVANCIEIAMAWLLLSKLNARDAGVRRQPEMQDSRPLGLASLSGPLNRLDLVERVEIAAKACNEGIVLIFLDLDNFKYVNDTLGHRVGDILLTKVADRLRDSVRDRDAITHLGGDEFAILLTESPPTAAEITAHWIAQTMSPPFLVEGQNIRIGASLGIATWQQDVHFASELIRRADIALYSVKVAGRGGFQLFDGKMDSRWRKRQELEQNLRQALADNAFEIHYQPIISLATNHVIAFEALIRWRHSAGHLVSPAEFIPVAEELGLIVPIGDWMLRRACKDAMQWPAHVKLSVNFSRAQFEMANVRSQLEAALSDAGLPAKRLELEITETTVMADLERANMLLDEFRELGIEIAMDDFGTGYSSLGCLRNCTIDRLKIDRAFIRDLTTSREARAILTMIVNLATTLGIQTTAEGVETLEQYEIVKEEGCGAMQGYFFSPARPADEVQRYIEVRDRGAGAAA